MNAPGQFTPWYSYRLGPAPDEWKATYPAKGTAIQDPGPNPAPLLRYMIDLLLGVSYRLTGEEQFALLDAMELERRARISGHMLSLSEQRDPDIFMVVDRLAFYYNKRARGVVGAPALAITVHQAGLIDLFFS